MHFAAEIRQQLAQQPPEKPCCMRAELAAMLRAGGSLALYGAGRWSLNLNCGEPAVARRCFVLLKRVHGIAPQVIIKEGGKPGGGRRITLVVGNGADAVLQHAGMLSPEGTPTLSAVLPRALVSRDCCRRAYLRGAFLFAGTAADPGKGYGMEFNLSGARPAKDIARLLKHYGIAAGESKRGDGLCVFIRSAEGVVTLLTLLGANAAMLALENTRIIRGALGNVNRALNCDAANLNKSLSAAQRHIEAIASLEASGGYRRLSAKLREAAEMRTAYPEMPLADLADVFNPPLSKSALYHRLEKIAELAEGDGGGE